MSASVGMLGGARAQYHLRQIFVYLNMYPINGPEVIVTFAQDKFDANGNLFVADEGNNRIQKFSPSPVNYKFIPRHAGTYKVVAIFSNGCKATSKEIIVAGKGHIQII